MLKAMLEERSSHSVGGMVAQQRTDDGQGLWSQTWWIQLSALPFNSFVPLSELTFLNLNFFVCKNEERTDNCTKPVGSCVAEVKEAAESGSSHPGCIHLERALNIFEASASPANYIRLSGDVFLASVFLKVPSLFHCAAQVRTTTSSC